LDPKNNSKDTRKRTNNFIGKESFLLLDGMISLYKSLDKESNKQTFELIDSKFQNDPKWILVKLQEAKENVEICSVATSLISSFDFDVVEKYDSSLFSPTEKTTRAKETAKIEKQKAILIEALYRKSIALYGLKKKEEFEQGYSLLSRLVSVHEKRSVIYAYICCERMAGRYGNALLATLKALKEAVPADSSFTFPRVGLSKCKSELLDALGWKCWNQQAKKAHLAEYEMKNYVF